MSNVDVERYLEGAFVESLREIYRYDDDFIYDDDDTLTNVIISSGYPSKDDTFKIPQILILGVNYQFNVSSLSNNFDCDILDKETGLFTIGKAYAAQVPYSVNIACIGQNDAISKILANKTANYINFQAREVFEDVYLLNIQSVGKSGGGIDRHLSESVFSNSVVVSGSIIWQGSKVPVNMDIINKIKLTIKEKL